MYYVLLLCNVLILDYVATYCFSNYKSTHSHTTVHYTRHIIMHIMYLVVLLQLLLISCTGLLHHHPKVDVGLEDVYHLAPYKLTIEHEV